MSWPINRGQWVVEICYQKNDDDHVEGSHNLVYKHVTLGQKSEFLDKCVLSGFWQNIYEHVRS